MTLFVSSKYNSVRLELVWIVFAIAAMPLWLIRLLSKCKVVRKELLAKDIEDTSSSRLSPICNVIRDELNCNDFAIIDPVFDPISLPFRYNSIIDRFDFRVFARALPPLFPS